MMQTNGTSPELHGQSRFPPPTYSRMFIRSRAIRAVRIVGVRGSVHHIKCIFKQLEAIPHSHLSHLSIFQAYFPKYLFRFEGAFAHALGRGIHAERDELAPPPGLTEPFTRSPFTRSPFPDVIRIRFVENITGNILSFESNAKTFFRGGYGSARLGHPRDVRRRIRPNHTPINDKLSAHDLFPPKVCNLSGGIVSGNSILMQPPKGMPILFDAIRTRLVENIAGNASGFEGNTKVVFKGATASA